MTTPLLVHVLFHPESKSARTLFGELHRALNDDPALPGLRIPTLIAAEDGSAFPPSTIDFEQATRNAVVVLADDDMTLEPGSVPKGRRSWPAFVADAWESCRSSGHRFIPVQLTQAAWPLDPRLQGTSFLRAYLKDPATLPAFVTRAVVVELCRYLLGLEHGTKLPLRLFLSHSKLDIQKEPKVFEEIAAYLDATQPVEAWVDSSKIEGGSEFAVAITQGVKDSALLVLATKSYSSRPWCRKEILLAKRHGRPVVVVDALEGLDVRSFPYAGNVPEMRWTAGGAERAVDLVLKETLRTRHASLVLNARKSENDVVLTAAPELATIVALPRGTPVLYPDPPLGDEELSELEPLGHRLETPLQRAGKGRTLDGVRIALSTSESDDPERYGVTHAHREAALLEITRQLLVRGAVLHYGGHFGPTGYTVALFDLVAAHNAHSGLPPAARIVNDVGWPLPLEKLPKGERAKFQLVAQFRRVPRPAGIEALEPATFVEEPFYFPADSDARRFAWARGMSAMRDDQTARVRARVVLGGKIGPTLGVAPDGSRTERWYSGRIPGVAEEAYASIHARAPVYLVGGFGGAARLVGELLQGRPRDDFTWDYQRAAPHTEGMKKLYQAQGLPWLDYADISRELGQFGLAAISAANGLSVVKNEELLESRDVSRIVELLLEGLGTLGPGGA